MFRKLFRRKRGEGGDPQPPAVGPRRREHERIAYRVPLRARCSSWTNFHDLFSGNISKGGLFVPSEELPALGEKIELELVAPDGQPLPLTGQVVHIFEGGEGRPRGLGICLDSPSPEQDQLYRKLLEEAAEQARVKPTPEAMGETGPFPMPAGALERAIEPPLAGGLFGAASKRPVFGVAAKLPAPSPSPPSETDALRFGGPPLTSLPLPSEVPSTPSRRPPVRPAAAPPAASRMPPHSPIEYPDLFASSEKSEDDAELVTADDIGETPPPSDDIPVFYDGPTPASLADTAPKLHQPLGGVRSPSSPAKPPPPPPPISTKGAPSPRRPPTPPPPPPPPRPPASPHRDRVPSISVVSVPRDATVPARAANQERPTLVGVDFGTSMSSLALVRGGEIHVLRTPCGRYDIPSVVAFERDSVLVGRHACERLVVDPTNAIASPKRLLGRRHDERELEAFLATLAMPNSAGTGGEILLQPPAVRRMSAAQVCAPIIAYLREEAELQLGVPIRQAVLTAPVSFDQRRCDALVEAASLAGLEVIGTVDEPTAASLTYSKDPSYHGLVAVYDFGGGTFDFSVVDVTTADVQVVATAGDTWLGGDDFDDALVGAAANAFWREHHVEIRNQTVQLQRLRMAAERTKRELSVRQEALVELRKVALTSRGALDLRFPVTRAAFAELSAPIIRRSLDTCEEALALCDIKPSQLNAVYLSGGTCYVPAVREAVARFFGKQPKVAVPPERAVVMGAALFAAQNISAQIRY